MGNTFTYYQGDKRLNVKAPETLYAFVILDSNLSSSDITLNDHWTVSQHQTGTGPDTYNLLFRYKPGGVSTAGEFENRIVFTTSTDLDADLTIHFVIDTTNDGTASNDPVFNDPYNIVTVETSAGSGGGDPHIIPLYNPKSTVYLLPTDNKTYRYFDTNMSENMRLIINARMWIISNAYIDRLERLIKNGKLDEYHKQKKEIEFPTEISPLETSFMRYIDFYGIIYNEDKSIKKQYKLAFDMETLEFDGKIPNLKVSELKVTKNAIYYPGTKNVAANKEYDRHRIVTIKTENYGELNFKLYLTPMRPNHRNHIEILSKSVNKIIENCYGCLVSVNTIATCNDIEFPEELENIDNLQTLNEYRKQARNYRRKKARESRRKRI